MKRSSVFTAKSYYMTFPAPVMGWACITICDATGLVAVHSDWLEGTYRWPTTKASLGFSTLTEFIAQAGIDYMARKLFVSETKRYDHELTASSLREQIRELRRGEYLTADQAREQYEAVNDVHAHHIPDCLGEYGDCIVSSPSDAFKYMVSNIMPALQEAVRASINTYSLITVADPGLA
jgi:hypothetical protein